MREGSDQIGRKQEGRKLGLLGAREGSSVRVAPHQKRLLSVDIYTQASHCTKVCESLGGLSARNL